MNTDLFKYVQHSFLIPGGEINESGVHRNGEVYLVSENFIVRFLQPDGLIPDQLLHIIRTKSDQPYHSRVLINGRALMAHTINAESGHIEVADADEAEPLYLSYIDVRRYRATRLSEILNLYLDCYFTGPRARLTDMARRGQARPIYKALFQTRQAEHTKQRKMAHFGTESPLYYAFPLPQSGKTFEYMMPGIAFDMFADMDISLSAPGHIPDELRDGSPPPAVAYNDQVVVLLFSPDRRWETHPVDEETGLYVSPRHLAWFCDRVVNKTVENSPEFFLPTEETYGEPLDVRLKLRRDRYKDVALYVSYRRWQGDSQHEIEQQLLSLRDYYNRIFVKKALETIENVIKMRRRLPEHEDVGSRNAQQARVAYHVLETLLGNNIPLSRDDHDIVRSIIREV